jgi:PAS domain S-box-containing protein
MRQTAKWAGGSASSYVVAIIAVLAAVGLRWLIDPWLGDRLTLVTLYGAVALAVWFGGYRPALLTTLAGYLACDYLFIKPRGSFDFSSPAWLLGFLAYAASCAIIIGFGEAMRRARQRAWARQELLRIALTSIGDAVITTDTEGRVTSLNAEAAALTGWTPGEAAGKPLDEVFRILNEKTRQKVENPALRALKEGKAVGLGNHSVLVAKDGTERPIDDSAAPIRDAEGAPAGCVLVFRDVTDRRRNEAALRNQEQDLSDFFENASVGLHWIGSDGTILRVNQAELDMLGYGREEYVGRNIAEFHVDPEVIAGMLQRLAEGETLRDQPARMLHKNGSVRDVLINSNALRKDGRFVHTRCFTRDVTDLQEAQSLQALLASIVSASDDAIIGKTLEGTILTWNRGAERLFEYTAAEAVGKSILLIIPPERHGEERVILEKLRRGERVDHFETVRVTKSGRRLDISLTSSPIHDASGRVIGASKIARDITLRRRAEEGLRAAERQLQVITESISAPIARCSNDLRYVWVGKRFAEWLQLRPEEIVGRSIAEVIGLEAITRLQPYIDRVLSGEEVQFEVQIDYPKIGPRWVSAMYSPTFDTSGAVSGWVSVVTDIEARKAEEEALKNADRRKDEFLATLAHELRNPLAPIRNSLEIMKLAQADAEVATKARDMIDRQVSHMERLIDDLLDVSRITRNRLELRRQRIDLQSVIHQAVEASRPLAERLGHEIRVNLPSEPLVVHGDPVRLAQVFGNLLNNSCKYTRRGGLIEVSAERQGGIVTVSVRDNGIGISAEMLPRIFDMFTQGDQRLERASGGLGIGLTLVRQLVEMHNGRVDARSAGPDQGSTFHVRLPALAEKPLESSLDGTTPDRQATPALRILVVDDNQDSAHSLSTLLAMNGNQTQTAYDGLEAVEAAKTFQPDVLMLDIGLPKMNGFETCRLIREQPWGKNMLLVALTGWGQEEDRQRSREAGFDAHLVKPVSHAALLELLASFGAKGRAELAE